MAQDNHDLPQAASVEGESMVSEAIAELTLTDLTQTPKAPASLNIAAYPHLLSLILDYSPPSTHSAFLRSSQTTFQSVVGPMYRTLRITSEQLVSMVETGWAPSKRASTSGRLGDSFSPYLLKCFKSVQSLHLLDYTPEQTLPAIPSGCFEAIENVILHLADTCTEDQIRLQPTLYSLNATHLYIRISSQCRKHSQPGLDLCNPPMSVQAVTLLVPNTCILQMAPFLDLVYEPLPLDGLAIWPQVSVVLLPWKLNPAEELPGRSQVVERWTSEESSVNLGPSSQPICFVGVEYCGSRSDQQTLKAAFATHNDRTQSTPSFSTFADWFDDVELETVFSLQEGGMLWLGDLVQPSFRWSEEQKQIELDSKAFALVVRARKESYKHGEPNTREAQLLFRKMCEEEIFPRNDELNAEEERIDGERERLSARVKLGYPGVVVDLILDQSSAGAQGHRVMTL